MIPILIGISSGLLTIMIIALMRGIDKPTMYGLVLSGIGFLYVGYTWADVQSLVINCLQAIVFILIAYFGIRKNSYLLVAGYFLHGSWDLVYNLFPDKGLLPPHYDLFCSSLDFIIGFYLLAYKFKEIPEREAAWKP